MRSRAMPYGVSNDLRGRFSAALAAGAVQAVVLVALVLGLAAHGLDDPPDTLTAVRFAPPPPEPSPSPVQSDAPKVAERDGRKGSALPKEAPHAEVALPAPAAAPTAQQGAAVDSAPGEAGSGSGTGLAGTGAGGGGGGGTPARRIAGALTDRDYPVAAARIRAAGVVAIRFRVTEAGRVTDCQIARSSGTSVLDETTCRLVEKRFRYAPARDASGHAVEDTVTTSFTWGPRF